jgi:GDP-L-fucose synthase
VKNKSKVLIVGANGLVGSSCKNILKNSKYVSELLTSSREDTDLFKLDETKKLIEVSEPDVLVIAAAKVGGIYANNTMRYEFIMQNLKINMNLLEACAINNKIKIINLGSSCIYPLNAKDPIKEEEFMDGKLEPTNSPYAMAKLTSIEIGRTLSHQFGHSVINLMPTNLYGPNDYFSDLNSHVIPALMLRMHKAKINNDKNFEIWGSGKPLREFLYVDDLAYCIENIISKDLNEDLYNVGSGEEVSILELGKKIKKTVGFEGDLSFDTSKPDGNPRKLLDSSRIYATGWKPTIDLDAGLMTTYRWFLENVKLDSPK